MILIADANRSTAELLVRRLRMEGLPADAASSVASVRKRLEAGGVTALVIDPGMAGAGPVLLRALRADPATAALPVIAFGATNRPEDVAALRAAGAEFILKGQVELRVLVERILACRLAGQAKSPASPAGRSSGSSVPGGYYVWIHPQSGDAPRLSLDIGAAPGLRCSGCGGSMCLYLQRDFSRWTGWLVGTFGCLVCARRRAEPRPPLDVVPVAEELAHSVPIAAAAGGAS